MTKTKTSFEEFRRTAEVLVLPRCRLRLADGELMLGAPTGSGIGMWQAYWAVEPRGRRLGRYQLMRDVQFGAVIRAGDLALLIDRVESAAMRDGIMQHSLDGPRPQPTVEYDMVDTEAGPIITGFAIDMHPRRGWPITKPYLSTILLYSSPADGPDMQRFRVIATDAGGFHAAVEESYIELDYPERFDRTDVFEADTLIEAFAYAKGLQEQIQAAVDAHA